ncbi:hypothetical protein [uncultured Variovorax sp.]|uniref:hypothetical protein n=1 Tax=uncultured Variovorax sp. TaxID=114708 RepID=UPI002626B9E0|nr:hypothetical protein [uncultured Variovorax sp.]
MHILRFHSYKASALTVLACLGLAHSTLAAEPAGGSLALDRAPQSAAMADSVVTVDSLVKTENRLALARAEEQAVAAGLATPSSVKAPKASGPVAPRMTVLSIYGVGENLRANFTLDADLYENVRAGTKVGGCVVRSIQDRTVKLGAAGKKGGASLHCPSGEWTGLPGIQQMVETMKSARAGAAMPSPAVPMPFSSAGQPPGAFQQRPGQPMLQPAPAAPLIPRQTEAVTDARLDQPSGTN